MKVNHNTGLFQLLNEGLEKTHYAFSDIIQNLIRARGLAKSNQDEAAVAWLRELEQRAYRIRNKSSQMKILFEPYLKPKLDVISNCLDAELRRLYTLKIHLVENQKYEYVAQLRELQKDMQDMQQQIKNLDK